MKACEHPTQSLVVVGPKGLWCKVCGALGEVEDSKTPPAWRQAFVVGEHDRYVERVKTLEARADAAKVVLDGRG